MFIKVDCCTTYPHEIYINTDKILHFKTQRYVNEEDKRTEVTMITFDNGEFLAVSDTVNDILLKMMNKED